MTASVDRCKSWCPDRVGCRCIRKAGHDGQHTGMSYQHRVYWPLPPQTPECLICSIQIGDDPDDDLERMRCSDHSL